MFLSKTPSCLRLQVKPTQLGQIDRTILYLRVQSNKIERSGVKQSEREADR
jgi:hypothetical protein